MLDNFIKAIQSGEAYILYVKTWKQNPQNVYNLAAIAVALLIIFVCIRLGVCYLKSDITMKRAAAKPSEAAATEIDEPAADIVADIPKPTVEESDVKLKKAAPKKRATKTKKVEAVVSPKKVVKDSVLVASPRKASKSPSRRTASVRSLTPARAAVKSVSSAPVAQAATPSKKVAVTPKTSEVEKQKPATPAVKSPKKSVEPAVASKTRSTSASRSSRTTRIAKSAAVEKVSKK